LGGIKARMGGVDLVAAHYLGWSKKTKRVGEIENRWNGSEE
jgi:hypothetical protein